MEVLEQDEKTAIWFDHAKLINDSFKHNISNVLECFELKKELFYFHAKHKNESQTATTNETAEKFIKSKKRKHSQTSARVVEVKQEDNLVELQQKIAMFLQKLEDIKTFATACATTKITNNKQRCWEEQHEFPKFRGANNTSEFQRFTFGEQTYLIPPQCKFYNHNVNKLHEILDDVDNAYDLIVMDPPWRNKYIRRLKRLKQELSYHMLDNDELKLMPIDKLIHSRTLVAIWCTNAQQHQRAILERFLPAWNLRLVHSLKWLKVCTSGEPIGDINSVGNKQPYEMLYIACHKADQRNFQQLCRVELLISVPSIVHSHKPPLIQLLEDYLPEKSNCLELFARYLQPQFTSIGLEVLKLMDERLYEKVI